MITTTTQTPKSLQWTLKRAVRHFYDVQDIRMLADKRSPLKKSKWKKDEKKKAAPPPLLTPFDMELMKAQSDRLKAMEAEAFASVTSILETIPFYVEVLKKDDPRWVGMGPTISAVILSEVDIHRATTVSKLWRFAGLGPEQTEPTEKAPFSSVIIRQRCLKCSRLLIAVDGGWKHAPRKANEKPICKLEKAVLQKGQTRDSTQAEHPVEKTKRHYNLFLKTKLLGVLGDLQFVTRTDCVWNKVYKEYKQRMITMKHATSPGHAHRMAVRKAVKMFLIEVYKEWRAFEGLEVRPPYQEEKLGHRHVG